MNKETHVKFAVVSEVSIGDFKRSLQDAFRLQQKYHVDWLGKVVLKSLKSLINMQT